MKLTIKKFMAEPTFKNETKNDYNTRYDTIKNDIKISWYHITDLGRLILHFKIPSEKAEKIMYDVLVELNTGKDSTYREFRNADIRVFSNCPSFVFTNANYCDTNGILIDWAKPLYNKESLQPPKTKEGDTSQSAIKCEKSLYFAMYYLNSLNPVQLYTYAGSAVKLPNAKAIARHIEEYDWVMEKRSNYNKKQTLLDKITKDNIVARELRRSKNSVGIVSNVDSIKNGTKSVKSAFSSKVKKVKHI